MVDFSKLRATPRITPTTPRLIVAITGHRPDKLGGYDRDNPIRVAVREQIRTITQELLTKPTPPRDDYMDAMHTDMHMRQVVWQKKPDDLTAPIGLSGCALGADQDACGVWYRMGLPYVAVVPFPGQESWWPRQSQDVYASVLKHAAGIVHVSNTAPSGHDDAVRMLHARNEWLCAAADELIAVYDGSKGGTANCIYQWNRFKFYAKLHRIDPREVTHGNRN